MVRLVLLIGTLVFSLTARADEPARPEGAAASDIDFARDIRPIFAQRCYSCHGPEKAEGSLRLDRRADALAGGAAGPALVAHKSAESRIIAYVTGENEDGLTMPPEGEPLAKEQIALLKRWIDAGAPWPAEASADAGPKSKHWAYQPIGRVDPPAVQHTEQVRNPIDAFILARLEPLGLQLAPEADRPTLARRLSIDLRGLPPAPAEVAEFVADTRADAYERLVDRLLASPHYGERWGRHWLDLARYADSDGYEKDQPRPHAWRYRHWVIDALNRDLPFDQFTVEQLAGDLLQRPSTEQLIATGFHRNTLLNREGGVDQEEFRVAATIDRVNTTGAVWLGLTVGCAQCHTHKYDPISQREYYGLYTFFNSLEDYDLPLESPDAATPAAANYRAAKKTFDRQRKRLKSAVAAAEKLGLPLKGALAAFDKTKPVDPSAQERAQTLRELAKPRATHILVKGDFLRPGAEVDAHTLAVLHPFKARGARPDRLDLARWLVDPANPLTARVTMNRVWQVYFGRGLTPTSNDFGSQGEPPTHPELLDWLARKLIARGWSLKEMHRLIVGSATYRQSSNSSPALRDRDPYNTLLARQSRLRVEAEIVRDLALASSGLLNSKIGGPSVRPEQPAGVADLGYQGSVTWKTSEGVERYRRGMYTFFQRTVPYPMLMAFDAPDSNVTCTRRERSNTPLQSLTLLNDPVFVECAQGLARRIVRETPTTADAPARVKHAVELCLGRAPTSSESAALVELYQTQLALGRADPAAAKQLAGDVQSADKSDARPTAAEELAAWVVVGRTLLNLDEFITRE